MKRGLLETTKQRAYRKLARRHADEFQKIVFIERIAATGVAVEVTTEAALRDALTRPVPFLALPGEVPT